jgi:hypothetical protein
MRFLTAILILGLAASRPLPGHHAFAAEFSSNPVTLTGTVTKVAWLNPHARFFMTVNDGSGSNTNWELVLGSPNVLMRQGWSRTTLKSGDHVTVNGYVAKDGSHMAAARVIKDAEGKRLFIGALGDGGPDK